jgi:diaminohydroxyphosphoribosylaminopyrimidine deaminase/5-amino-6-(5-phosphoribosylamino)uracil reductase
VQKLRSTVDAILTSGETVRRDNPALNIRIPDLLEGRLQPWRVIASDRPESLSASAAVFTDSDRDRTLIRPRSDLANTLRSLAREQGVLTVMVEAGGVFSAALFEAGLIDEVVAYYAPMLCGGPLPALGGDGLPGPLHLDEVEFAQLENDIRMRGVVRR